MSSLRDAFETFWRRRYGVVGAVSSAVPALECFDSKGHATVDGVESCLTRCRQRMAELRMKIREEEHLEEFLCGVLQSGMALFPLQDSATQPISENLTEKVKSYATPPLSADVTEDKASLNLRLTIAERRMLFEKESSRSVEVDGMKKAPKLLPKRVLPKSNATAAEEKTEKVFTITPSEAKSSNSAVVSVAENNMENSSAKNCVDGGDGEDCGSDLREFESFTVPKSADDLLRINNEETLRNKSPNLLSPDSAHSCLDQKRSTDSNGSSVDGLSSSGSVRRKNRVVAVENLNSPNVESPNEDEVSDDEVSNFLALRQSVNFASKWCEGVDSSRTRLEEQAQRLSKRFTQLSHPKMLDIVKTQELDVVAESPLSPSPSIVSGFPEQTGGSETDWIPTTPALLDLGIGHDELQGTQLYPEKGEMRGWVVASLQEGEKSYMEVLDSLINYKQMFKNFAGTPNMVITMADVETIFHRVADLHKIHYQFVRDLEPKVIKWSSEQQIAEIFKVLAMEEYSIAPDYLRNYSKALSTLHSCRQASPRFDELTKEISVKGASGVEKTTLEDMLHKPIVRFQRNTLLLHDLIKYTPTSHPDYDLLQKTLKFARRFLDDLENSESNKDSSENQRYLARHGIIVEKVSKHRKLRHIFLFNDIVIGAKQKPPSRSRIQYEVKWFIPLTDISLEDKVGLKDDVILEHDQREEVALLQKKISDLQAEHKAEMKKAKQAAESSKIKLRKPVGNKNIDRIRKKLMELEAALVIASPNLVFRLYNPKAQKQYLLMMSSDYERTDWKDSITGLLFKAPVPVHLAAADVQNLINKQKLANMKVMGGVPSERDSIFMEEERLYGSLHVRVGRLQGLKHATSSVCHIEVDAFGHFTLKAKTNFTAESVDPAWNEDFEIDLDGAQTLRFLCYHRAKGVDQLFGKGALELRSVWLKDGAEEDCVVSINNEMSITVSLQYTSREKTIPRCLSTVIDGLFGIRLDIITAREREPIPILLRSCVEEIERRGLTEEGLYRVSGLYETVQLLKDAFEKSSLQAVSLLKTADVNSLTGLIKLFFRNLPESLFTDALYKNFQDGIGLADPDARDKCLTSLFGMLPEPNFSTALFLLDHLIRVAKHAETNKMTLKNLATIFGPTLLRPATRNSQTQTMEQLFFMSAHEAMIQTTILLHIMTLRADGIEFKHSTA